MKSTLKALSFFAFALNLVACDRGTIDSNNLAASADNWSPVYRDYRVGIKEGRKKAMASATFSLNNSWGTTVKLSEPATLAINGEPTRVHTDEFDGDELAAFYLGFIIPQLWLAAGASGTTYSKALYGAPSDVQFQFTDINGKTYHDAFFTPNLSLNIPSTVYRNDGFDIIIHGGKSSGSISVMIKQGSLYETISAKGNRITITEENIQQFSSGRLKIELEYDERITLPKDEFSAGGRMSLNYAFTKRTISLQ